MRPSSRCGICSCHLFCGGGLSWCHSYCLLKDCFRPLPAGPFHWGVIPCIWWLVSGLSDAKLWLAKETWTVMVEPELQLTRTMAFFFFFFKSTRFYDSKWAHSEQSCTTRRLPFAFWLLQSFSSGSWCTMEHFSTLHFVRMTAALHPWRMSLW